MTKKDVWIIWDSMIDSFDYSGTLGQLHQNYRHKKLNKILSKHLQNIRLV